MQKEIWKPVRGYEISHEVSNLGRIRTVDRVQTIDRMGKTIFRKKSGQLITPRERHNGYFNVNLTVKYPNGPQNELSVHRMVAMAFIPNPKNKPEVNHKNGKKADNKRVNLEWVTKKENMDHARKNGFIKSKKK